MQAGECSLVEHIGDQAHVLYHGDRSTVADRHPRRLLSAVLKRVEAEVGEVGDGVSGGEHPEDATSLP